MPVLATALSPQDAAALASAWRFADKEGMADHPKHIEALVESMETFADLHGGYEPRKPRIDVSKIEVVSIPGVTEDS
jgi:hypothetical protein